jgi:hypothetical protein
MKLNAASVFLLSVTLRPEKKSSPITIEVEETRLIDKYKKAKS